VSNCAEIAAQNAPPLISSLKRKMIEPR